MAGSFPLNKVQRVSLNQSDVHARTGRSNDAIIHTTGGKAASRVNSDQKNSADNDLLKIILDVTEDLQIAFLYSKLNHHYRAMAAPYALSRANHLLQHPSLNTKMIASIPMIPMFASQREAMQATVSDIPWVRPQWCAPNFYEQGRITVKAMGTDQLDALVGGFLMSHESAEYASDGDDAGDAQAEMDAVRDVLILESKHKVTSVRLSYIDRHGQTSEPEWFNVKTIGIEAEGMGVDPSADPAQTFKGLVYGEYGVGGMYSEPEAELTELLSATYEDSDLADEPRSSIEAQGVQSE